MLSYSCAVEQSADCVVFSVWGVTVNGVCGSPFVLACEATENAMLLHLNCCSNLVCESIIMTGWIRGSPMWITLSVIRRFCTAVALDWPYSLYLLTSGCAELSGFPQQAVLQSRRQGQSVVSIVRVGIPAGRLSLKLPSPGIWPWQMRIHSPLPHKLPVSKCSDYFFNYFTLGVVSWYRTTSSLAPCCLFSPRIYCLMPPPTR